MHEVCPSTPLLSVMKLIWLMGDVNIVKNAASFETIIWLIWNLASGVNTK